ncbi:unnamed protein product [Didymodactylos carnosus]|uniref:Uncharacterized protein n=1 Tax=Didymodactylos carnosus TaxID=1234261 RepID=A0A813R7F8_9BILA|nr:unnamed protein product [Didymodactylos carnosus]CAF3559657.1 unnamed protein product [Didymodactylos carnosus]
MRKICSTNGQPFDENECRKAISKQVTDTNVTAADQQKKNEHKEKIHDQTTVIAIRSSSITAMNHLSPMTNLNRTRLVPPFDPVLSSTPKILMHPAISIKMDIPIRSSSPPPPLSSTPQGVKTAVPVVQQQVPSVINDDKFDEPIKENKKRKKKLEKNDESITSSIRLPPKILHSEEIVKRTDNIQQQSSQSAVIQSEEAKIRSDNLTDNIQATKKCAPHGRAKNVVVDLPPPSRNMLTRAKQRASVDIQEPSIQEKTTKIPRSRSKKQQIHADEASAETAAKNSGSNPKHPALLPTVTQTKDDELSKQLPSSTSSKHQAFLGLQSNTDQKTKIRARDRDQENNVDQVSSTIALQNEPPLLAISVLTNEQGNIEETYKKHSIRSSHTKRETSIDIQQSSELNTQALDKQSNCRSTRSSKRKLEVTAQAGTNDTYPKRGRERKQQTKVDQVLREKVSHKSANIQQSLAVADHNTNLPPTVPKTKRALRGKPKLFEKSVSPSKVDNNQHKSALPKKYDSSAPITNVFNAPPVDFSFPPVDLIVSPPKIIRLGRKRTNNHNQVSSQIESSNTTHFRDKKDDKAIDKKDVLVNAASSSTTTTISVTARGKRKRADLLTTTELPQLPLPPSSLSVKAFLKNNQEKRPAHSRQNESTLDNPSRKRRIVTVNSQQNPSAARIDMPEIFLPSIHDYTKDKFKSPVKRSLRSKKNDAQVITYSPLTRKRRVPTANNQSSSTTNQVVQVPRTQCITKTKGKRTCTICNSYI